MGVAVILCEYVAQDDPSLQLAVDNFFPAYQQEDFLNVNFLCIYRGIHLSTFIVHVSAGTVKR